MRGTTRCPCSDNLINLPLVGLTCCFVFWCVYLMKPSDGSMFKQYYIITVSGDITSRHKAEGHCRKSTGQVAIPHPTHEPACQVPSTLCQPVLTDE